jgi:CRP-like cAMP-binding protein
MTTYNSFNNGDLTRGPAHWRSGGNGAAKGDGVAAAAARAGIENARRVGVAEPPPMNRLLANSLLGALPDEDFARLLPGLEPVSLTTRDSLQGPLGEMRYAYFPEDVVISHITSFADGSAAEVALTGREGVAGLGVVLGPQPASHQARVTVPGSALRMRAELFAGEFCAGAPFRRLLVEHAGRHLAQVAQRSACANRHRLSERVAGWLLLVQERAGSEELSLTQELIANRLGARRAGVTQIACDLQQRGLISYGRGLIRILDRAGLESAACECYAVLRDN